MKRLIHLINIAFFGGDSLLNQSTLSGNKKKDWNGAQQFNVEVITEFCLCTITEV